MIEIMLGVLLVSVLVSIAVPGYQRFVESSRQATAAADIRRIELVITRFRSVDNNLPDSLANVREDQSVDPWGNHYVYKPLRTPSDVGSARKDRNLVPLNTDFDLYSVGKDGASQAPLAAKVSHDDVIRANNGRYVGLASDY